MAVGLAHPFTVAFARCWVAMGAQMRRDVAIAFEQADAALVLATEHGFPMWAAHATEMRGWALAVRDRSEEVSAAIPGIAGWRVAGAAIAVSYRLTKPLAFSVKSTKGFDRWMKRRLCWSNRRIAGRKLFRLRGELFELLLWQSNAPEASVEAWLRRALDVREANRPNPWNCALLLALRVFGARRLSIAKRAICSSLWLVY